MTAVRSPLALWAQSSSSTTKENNFIYLTIIVPGLLHPTLSYTVTNTTISLTVDAKEEGDAEQSRYGFNLDFHANIDPVATRMHAATAKSLNFIIFKEDINLGHWPRLSTVSLDYVKPNASPKIGEGDLDKADTLGPVAIENKTGGLSTTIRWARWLHQLANFYSNRYKQGRNLADIECAICHFTQAIYLVPSSNSNLRVYHSNLGTALKSRFERTGNLADIDASISQIQQALQLTPSGDGELPSCHNKLGNSFLCRFLRLGDIADIASSIFHHQKAVDLTPSTHVDLPLYLNNLGNSFNCRFGQTGTLADIDSAIFSQQRSVNMTSDGDADLPSYLNSLGGSYLRRFQRSGNIVDIDFSICHRERAVKLTPTGHASLPLYFNNIGGSYSCRFEQTGAIEDIDSAVSYQQKAVDLTPADHASLPPRLSNLGNSFNCRFNQTGALADIDLAISCQRKAMDLTPKGHAQLPFYFSNVGGSYLRRFKQTGAQDDIDLAISNIQNAVQCTPVGHANLPVYFSNIGNCYSIRFERMRVLQDIQSAISYQQKALNLTPIGHTSLPSCLHNLGNSYLNRFKQTGALEDINFAISYQQKAVDLTPADHVYLPSRLNNLGFSFNCRFERTGSLTDINSAILYKQKAVHQTPAGDVNLPSYLSNLGSSYLRRFQRFGDSVDIESSILNHQQAVDLTPAGHNDLPSRLNNLGNSFNCRFERMGALADIDSAISIHQKAVHLAPEGYAEVPSYLSNLGGCYLRRFERSGDFVDVKLSISYRRQALELAPVDYADLTSYLNNLGNSYLHQFLRTKALVDIDTAVSYQQKALDLTPPNHAILPSYHSNLGIVYLHRSKQTGTQADIDSAISNQQEAVDLTPTDHAYLPSRLNTLGNCYIERFKHSNDLAVIDFAIRHHQHAVDLTPAGHVGLPLFLTHLGDSFKLRFQQTGDPADIAFAITHYRLGAQALGVPLNRLHCAKSAAFASQKSDDITSIEDFGLCLGLLAEVAALDQTIHQRHLNLSEHSDFVSHAVAAALDACIPDRALEWLEQGRCLVWNQINQLRTPVNQLLETNHILGESFTNIAAALESFGTRYDNIYRFDYENMEEAMHLQDKTLLHTRTAAKYKMVLDEIRSLTGFEDFLQPSKAISILSSLPTDGPVILFNVHTERCDALALISGSNNALHIPLNECSHQLAKALQDTMQSEITNHLRTGQSQARGAVDNADSSISLVLEVLWYKVVKPVLDALAYKVPVNRSDRPRIWWCPSGPFSFLPLHAAGLYNPRTQPSVAVSDYVVSSYTPTARSIKEKFSKPFAPLFATSLLLVSQPHTPGLPSILSTKQETHELKIMMEKAGFEATLLEGSNATQEKVKEELNVHTWAHFACHGVQDFEQPLKSGLCLHDGRLDLLEMMKQRITSPDLAFLSACQTGTGDSKLTEEVVHLAAGMLAAGYRGVVGTMWSISDACGPKFAKEFYQYLTDRKKKNGLDSSLAAYALDHATTEVRKSLGNTDGAFLTWVPYVHFGY